ncbi:hypothetical protein ICN48_04560 [Polynucleobacter sp. JS-Safj-400b-B2]|uniref:hypothetical protein n=1 Tax=Polynucleobacter sp. JS-Safj-400b-B2 TaxID=2576921 RepID=UPI001C0BFCC2|nr:hypothetical protein [Polynucleobacter sp. JS-Safj-400b-B2]MBU3625506.1 hypothetical protein [Polynucleobacter sp. JS-Safj-400b-B2]
MLEKSKRIKILHADKMFLAKSSQTSSYQIINFQNKSYLLQKQDLPYVENNTVCRKSALQLRNILTIVIWALTAQLSSSGGGGIIISQIKS